VTFNFGGHYPVEEWLFDDVATHYVDFQIGRDFFHDLHRMHRDALADGATKALNKIFGSLPTSADTANNGGNDEDDDTYKTTSHIVIAVLVLLQVMSLLVIGVLVYRVKGCSGERDSVVGDGVSLHKGVDSSIM
jgi:hypothetical protein